MKDQTADALRGMVEVAEDMGTDSIRVTPAELAHLLNVYGAASNLIDAIYPGERECGRCDYMMSLFVCTKCGWMDDEKRKERDHMLAQLENLIQGEIG